MLATATFAVLAAGIVSGCGNQTITPPTPAPLTTATPEPAPTAPSSSTSTDAALSTATPTALPPGVPTDFPTRVPQPEGFEFDTGLKVRFDGKNNFTLRYSAAGDQSDAARNFIDTLLGNGFTVTSESIASDTKSGLWKLKGRGVTIAVAFNVVDGETNLILNVTLITP